MIAPLIPLKRLKCFVVKSLKHQLAPIVPPVEWDENPERVVKIPSLSLQSVFAIFRIEPHMRLSTSEKCRDYFEAEQNLSSRNDYTVLEPYLKRITPNKVLEIGPGLGRSVVYFTKKLNWNSAQFDLLEGEGDDLDIKYTQWGPRFEDSFCGDFTTLRNVLNHNNIQNYNIIDAYQTKLGDLSGPYDLIYSFYSVGFHWSLEYFLDDILRLMGENSVAIFTLSVKYKMFKALENIPHKVIEAKPLYPEHESHLLVMSKNPALVR